MSQKAVSVSQHAKERYAERIMGKDEKTDITVFIYNHEDKITQDIQKMVEYGDLLFTGKQSKGGNVVRVYAKDAWVLLVDDDKNCVITIFKIDLGVDDAFSVEYVNKIKERLSEATRELDEKKQELSEQTETYRQLVADNNDTIAEYRKVIRSLEEQNKGYQEVIQTSNANMFVMEAEVREILGLLVGRKTF